METQAELKIELERLLCSDRIRLPAVEEICQSRIDIQAQKIQETVFQSETYVGRPLNTMRIK